MSKILKMFSLEIKEILCEGYTESLTDTASDFLAWREKNPTSYKKTKKECPPWARPLFDLLDSTADSIKNADKEDEAEAEYDTFFISLE